MVVLATPAPAQDYQAEIDRYVIEPCIEHVVRRGDLLEHLSMTAAVELIKIVQAAEFESLYREIVPVVRDKGESQRKALYDFGLSMCISGAGN